MDVVSGPQGQLAWTEQRGKTQIVVVDGSGGRRDLLAAELVPSQPAFSPDGYQVAFASAKRGLFVTQSPSATPERLTDADDHDPAWLDAGRVVFTRRDGDGTKAMVAAVTESQAPTPLVDENRRVLDAMGGSVLLTDGERLLVWKDGREEPVRAPQGWTHARFARDRRGVVVTTDHEVRVGTQSLYRSSRKVIGAAITSDGRVVVAER